MKNFSKNIYKISFLFLAFSVIGGGEFFHHHETLPGENHCQACIFNQTLSASDADTGTSECSFLSYEYIFPSIELDKPESTFLSPASSRAPPFSS